ncbi:MAG: hypothetical protein ACFFCJ_04920 [Promethearchaeota archaeon]
MSSDTKRYLELRHRQMWLQLFSEGLNTFATEHVKIKILNERELPSMASSSHEVCDWICQTMDLLDSLIEDKETRRNIMLCCSHAFPVDRLKELREKYHQTRDIDKLIAFMCQDDSWHGLSYYEYSQRQGNTITVTKVPFDPHGYETTKEDAERRARYCHCPLIRPAIQNQQRISPTYCLCGSGWYKTLWEGILDQPVHVEVIETIASGGDHCQFVINLPEKLKETLPIFITSKKKNNNTKYEINTFCWYSGLEASSLNYNSLGTRITGKNIAKQLPCV